jgi:predicted permease
VLLPELSPTFITAFSAAAIATAKVFAMGAVGFFAVWRCWVSDEGLKAISALVASITLPCLIFYRFALQFDPQEFPGWWKLTLLGAAMQVGAVIIGKIVSSRSKNHEMTLLIGYQNAGFFVLPMLQALLPSEEFGRAALMLFVFIIFFNASLWTAGSWFLLRKRELDFHSLFLRPPTVATAASLLIFGVFHDFSHQFDAHFAFQILLGKIGATGSAPGVLQLIGDLTVPLATLVLGGAIAQMMRGGLANVSGKRAALEIAAWKLGILPLIGYLLLRFWPNSGLENDPTLRLLLMLQFAAPPAVNIAVFCQQHNFPMRLTPTACLVCYLLCIVTVPFWVALVM